MSVVNIVPRPVSIAEYNNYMGGVDVWRYASIVLQVYDYVPESMVAEAIYLFYLLDVSTCSIATKHYYL
jgi:hypothetical protein